MALSKGSQLSLGNRPAVPCPSWYTARVAIYVVPDIARSERGSVPVCHREFPAALCVERDR
jgi:hypothetical protein